MGPPTCHFMMTKDVEAKKSTTVMDETNEILTTEDEGENPMGKVSESEPENNQDSADVSIDDDDGSGKETTEISDDGDGDKDDKSKSNDVIKDNRPQEEKDKEVKENKETEKKRIEELKEKYKDWPLRNINEPHENDVMYGRGGGTNHHKGNKKYRIMVEDRKLEYVNSKRLDKPLVALEIIRIWRAQLPTGRFLKHNDKTGQWDDVGDKKAREKTSQALREKAPQIRKQQEEEEKGGGSATEVEGKTTRFAADTKVGKKSPNKMKKAILARDHSLGREYLASDEAISINDFTWQDPFKGAKRNTSMGSVTAPQQLPKTGLTTGSSAPYGRNNNQRSVGMPHSFTHGGLNQLPSPPDYYGRAISGEPRREYSDGSLGSWGAVPYPYPPQTPPPPPGGPAMHQRSGSWTHPLPIPSPQHGAHHQRSGYWGEQMMPPGTQGHHLQPPPPGAYGGYKMSGGSIGPPQGPYRQIPSPSHSTPSPPYNVMNIARTWSGGGRVQRTWSGDHLSPPVMGNPQFDVYPCPVPGADMSPPRDGDDTTKQIPRPTLVKRDTSNQNENYETKPSQIKRAALNRDQSATSNRLKKECMPEYFERKILNKEMQSLQEDTEQIRLSPEPDSYVQTLENTKPQPLSQ